MTTGGGKKNRRRGKNISSQLHKREIIFRDDQQLYGQVEKLLGDKRVLCKCSDQLERVCHIRGKFHRRVWINPGDIVLLSKREFEHEKADIIHKYTPEEGRFLIENGEFDIQTTTNTLCETISIESDHESLDDDAEFSDSDDEEFVMENI